MTAHLWTDIDAVFDVRLIRANQERPRSDPLQEVELGATRSFNSLLERLVAGILTELRQRSTESRTALLRLKPTQLQ